MLGLGLGLTNFGTRGGVSDVPDALSGASSMLDGEDGLAIDFSDQSIAIRDTTTPANNIASAGTVRNGALVGPGAKITYTSPSPKLCRKSDGTYGYRAHNIFMSSEDFDHANWVKTGVTSSGNILAASSGGTNHRITQNLSVTAPHRVVFEVKAGTHPYVQIYDGASVQNYATFNLATGVVGASGTNTTAQITSLSAGVYRCEVVWGTSASVNGNTFFALAANGSAAWGSTFTAAGTETVTLYKAHYHNHLAIPDYIKTTSTPLYDLPYDWTGTYYYPLAEPAATNLFLNSRAAATQNFSVTAQAYTLSFIGTGTITLSGTSTAGPLVGTGANDRVSLTFTPSAGTLTLTVSGTMDLVQLETGTVTTSPIITAGATVTRAADNLSIATSAFPSLGSAGTLYVKGATRTGTTGNLYAVQLYTNGNNFAAIRNDSGIGAQGVVFNGGSQVAAPAVFNWAAGATKKVAIRLSTDNTNICSGGTLGTNDTSCAMPSYTTLFIGSNNGNNNFNGHIHEIMEKPSAASDAELQAMTT